MRSLVTIVLGEACDPVRPIDKDFSLMALGVADVLKSSEQ